MGLGIFEQGSRSRAAREGDWERSNCPICHRDYPHKKGFTPVTCGQFDCLQEANRRQLLHPVFSFSGKGYWPSHSLASSYLQHRSGLTKL